MSLTNRHSNTRNMSEIENIQAGEEMNEETPKATQPKAKKAKADKSKPKAQPTQAKTDSNEPESTESGSNTQQTQPAHTQPRIKRGPARPHRRLAVDVIDSRITKLQKRLDRARSQIDDAARHVEGYLRERDFRSKEV
jgi:hypothetical protein